MRVGAALCGVGVFMMTTGTSPPPDIFPPTDGWGRMNVEPEKEKKDDDKDDDDNDDPGMTDYGGAGPVSEKSKGRR